MNSHELAKRLLVLPSTEVTASTDVSDKSRDDTGARVFSSDLGGVSYSFGVITLVFGLHDSNCE